MMVKGLTWTLYSVAALLLLLAGAWTASRLWPVPAAEREALDRLRQAPVADHAGFAQLWTMSYDSLDQSAREAVLARDAARWRASDGHDGAGYQASAPPQHDVLLSGRLRCASSGPGCLAQVRANPQRFAEAVQGLDGLQQRIALLAQAEHFRSPFRVEGAVRTAGHIPGWPPLPGFVALFQVLPAHALAHMQGDSARALSGLCEGIASGRRLYSAGDDLAVSSVGAALASANARMLADVLVELPADTPLPAVCGPALQPVAAEEALPCQAMRGEFAMMSHLQAQMASHSRWNGLGLDLQRTRLRLAPYYAWACHPDHVAATARGEVARPPEPQGKDFSCVANLVGCTLADATMPPVLNHARGHRGVQMVRLVNAQRWLRQQPGPPRQALAALPPSLARGQPALQLSADGSRLELAAGEQAASAGHDTRSVPLLPPPQQR